MIPNQRNKAPSQPHDPMSLDEIRVRVREVLPELSEEELEAHVVRVIRYARQERGLENLSNI